MTIALLYRRVSSDEQMREGLSMPAQLADTRRCARQQDWLIGGEYEDVLTGKRDDRPEYQALLAEARRLRAEGKPVAVVVVAHASVGGCESVPAGGVEGAWRAGPQRPGGGEVSDFLANIRRPWPSTRSSRSGSA